MWAAPGVSFHLLGHTPVSLPQRVTGASSSLSPQLRRRHFHSQLALGNPCSVCAPGERSQAPLNSIAPTTPSLSLSLSLSLFPSSCTCHVCVAHARPACTDELHCRLHWRSGTMLLLGARAFQLWLSCHVWCTALWQLVGFRHICCCSSKFFCHCSWHCPVAMQQAGSSTITPGHPHSRWRACRRHHNRRGEVTTSPCHHHSSPIPGHHQTLPVNCSHYLVKL